LSVGSTIGLSAVLYAIMTQHGYGFGLSFIVICVLGIILGAINGFLVIKLKIISVIATIATMKVYAGVARLLVPKGKAAIKGGLPDDFSYIGRGELFGLPLVLDISIILAVIFIIVQRKTVLGKYAIAIGGNREAAEL
jgi:ribose transport system permease protein